MRPWHTFSLLLLLFLVGWTAIVISTQRAYFPPPDHPPVNGMVYPVGGLILCAPDTTRTQRPFATPDTCRCVMIPYGTLIRVPVGPGQPGGIETASK